MRESRDHAGGRPHEILFGRQPVYEAFRAARRTIERLAVREGLREWPELEQVLAWSAQRGVPVVTANQDKLDSLADGGHHQGIVARTSPYPYVGMDAIFAAAERGGETPFVLVLDHVVDPQNVGSLLRSADAAGVHGVIIAERRAAGVTPAAVRASAGASEHVAVAMVVNISQAIEKLKAREFWVAGLEVDDTAKVYTEADLTGPIALVVGSEGDGMARLVREHCDFLVRIPQLGRVSSLNVATAGAVALFEIQRQRRSPAAGPRSKSA